MLGRGVVVGFQGVGGGGPGAEHVGAGRLLPVRRAPEGRPHPPGPPRPPRPPRAHWALTPPFIRTPVRFLGIYFGPPGGAYLDSAQGDWCVIIL